MPHSLAQIPHALVLIVIALVLAGCGDDGSINLESESPDGFSSQDTTGLPADAADDAAADLPPPEVELALQQPEAAKDYVFVASSGLDAVARIDARSLDIAIVPVGADPRIIRARKTSNTVAVLNYGTSDISVIHADGDTNKEVRLDIEPGLNQMVMSPTGRHVVTWYDENAGEPDDPVGSFQLINVARVVEGREAVVELAVSFHVRNVQFDDSGERAFIVTDDYLHIVDLNQVINQPDSWDPSDRTSVVDDPTAELDDREVLVTGDGSWAVIRRLSKPELTLVEIASGERVTVELSGRPTDVDLVGSADSIVAVVRETAEIVLLDFPDSPDDEITPTVVTAPMDIPIGQALLMPDQRHAVVFSTAADTATIGRLNLDTAELETWRLGSGKPIAGAALSPGGNRVFVQHVALPEDPDPVKRLHGFSILEFDSPENDGRPFDKLFQTDADTAGIVFTEDDRHVYATIYDSASGIQQVIHVALDDLTAHLEKLSSPPFVIGALPAADRVYVGQDHPVGRISFLDVETGRIQTITGFELNSLVR